MTVDEQERYLLFTQKYRDSFKNTLHEDSVISICPRPSRSSYEQKISASSMKKGYYKTHGCSDSLTCKVCGRLVVPTGAGSDHRIIAQTVSSSLHLDIEPGDREADCGGIKGPVGVWGQKNGEWAIIHRCRRCGI